MAAIITDQLRILNAKNFVSGVQSSTNSYYTFIGLPNASDYSSTWDASPPSPKDSLDQSNDYWDTMIALKKVNAGDITQVVKKNTWSSGNIYDMWRNDITRSNPSQPSGSFNIYSANYYVMNSDYRVYICLHNNALPENNFKGSPSLDEPTFTDLEPRAAGSSGDGYIWKYLYTIKPSDAIKFDSTNYIPVPNDWGNTIDTATVKANASSSGLLKIATIVNRGAGLGNANTYTNISIKGDGTGGKATVVVNADSKVQSVTITNGGSGYTYGTIDLSEKGVTGTTEPIFNVIIPPPGGHGFDIYSELGAYNVLTYSRYENDTDNPDFITGNQFARVGLVENPQQFGSTSHLTSDKAAATYALRLTGTGYSSVVFTADSEITQTVGLGSTAVGRVVSYDQTTGVLKYWQDRSNVGFNSDGSLNATPKYGFVTIPFEPNALDNIGGSLDILGGTATLQITTSFSGISTVINSKTYNLGQEFTMGVANPESKKYSGRIVYVDNRPPVTRSASQKEDVKIILQF
tara:strand:- start:13472 stop:15028 length:1557 start_codon:yes stop_codon:yes gene_type:complete